MRIVVSCLLSLLFSLCLQAVPAGELQELETGIAGEGVKRLGEYAAHELNTPETAIWDEREDVYLVSNVNGELDLPADNGFISRLGPDGEILELKWIDAARRDVTLHAPKDMLLTDRLLVVADVGAVHFFERDTGRPVNSVLIPASFMLNGLAMGSDGRIYVTDTGGNTEEEPGAIFRINRDNTVSVVARGPELDKPNGIIADGAGLLYAPFRRHADTLVHISPDGERREAVSVPGTELDGLLRLPDGSLLVTSWQDKAVFRITGDDAETLVRNIKAPAQIGYDASRNRLLVPMPEEHRLVVFELADRE